ncbi:hypothetical protein M9H77_12392 [Catharanthus roseus]|uniref:Uncharacterized protein n=1 Tax=Catharanthus roseus TaxID=4058 RepID=A0ACC0BHF4_CATRO|nr:hypothetical protein M9H77_12392 [Catharanthus roseus]
MVMCENWQVFVHNGKHNHAIGLCTHGHAQAAKLTEEQLIKTEQFKKSHVPLRNILQFFREQNLGCALRYNMPLLEVVGMTLTEEVAGVGVMIRDEQGGVLASMECGLRGIIDASYAELMAIWKGINLARETLVPRIIVESDCIAGL